MNTIYICTNKDFTLTEGLKGNYKIITDGTELTQNYPYPVYKADNELAPMKHGYSEGFMMYDIWKKDNTSEYITINHYRRHLQLQELEDNIHETVLPIPYNFDIYAQYAACHNVRDLNKCVEIINKYYPQYDTHPQGLFPCNISVLSHEDYNLYCEFVFNVLEAFNEEMNLHSDEDIRRYIEERFIKEQVSYQSRLQAFLMERIGTIYLANHFKGKPIRYSQIILK